MTDRNPMRMRVAFTAVLALALLLRVAGLEQNGWGADYYSAAVLSMTRNWHNFLFASFDPAGFISVDKPPLALWVQVVSASLFGFRPLALLLPQALMGVASIWIAHHLAHRAFGPRIALLAALLFAVAPVSVAVSRTNNMDSGLLLTLMLAVWALIVATEAGSRRHLLLAMAAIGLAFNTKMLAGLLPLPVFVLVYVSLAPGTVASRLRDLALGGIVLLLVALPWTLLVQLTDPADRPYVGSSRSNSMIELVLGHNARSRLFSPRPATAATPATSPAETLPSPPTSPSTSAPSSTSTTPTAIDAESGGERRANVRELAARLFLRAPTGVTRLFGGQPAAQIGWLLPLLPLGAAAWALTRRGRAPAMPAALPAPPAPPAVPATPATPDTQARRRRIALWFWSGWALCYALIYSALGGIIHFYYLSTLVPALSLLTAVAAAALWRLRGARSSAGWLLPVLPLLVLAWQLQVQRSAMGWTATDAFWTQRESWLNALNLLPIAGCAAAMLAMLLARTVPQWRAKAAALDGGALAVAFGALLLLPIGWSLSSVLMPGNGTLPSADLYRLVAASRDPQAVAALRYGRGVDTTRLSRFLAQHRRNEKFLLSTSTTQWAAPLILDTGLPVMARGGYHGLDAATTPQALADMVARGELRYALLNDVVSISRRLGADRAGKPVSDWILAHGRPVDPSLWRPSTMRTDAVLFDLRPD